MIQLTKNGLTGAANVEELAHQFEQSHAFRLPRLLHSDLLEMISSRLEHCSWTTQDDGTIAKEALPSDPAPASVLNFATNTSEFIDLMRRITNHPEIKLFGGRVYRMAPTPEHFDSWHADIGTTHQDRLVGMSINLSPRPYQGGVFRLRDEASGANLGELSNTGPGDAIFFRISLALKHMVTPLTGTESKTAFAGWFRSGGLDFYSRLKAITSEASDTLSHNEVLGDEVQKYNIVSDANRMQPQLLSPESLVEGQQYIGMLAP